MGKQAAVQKENAPRMSTPVTTPTISLKLMIDKVNKKVVFAEAGKNFVDFIFHMLAVPIGTPMSFIKKEDTDGYMEGSLANVFFTLKSFSSDYLQPLGKASSDFLLNPIKIVAAPFQPPLNSAAKTMYTCLQLYSNNGGCPGSVAYFAGVICPKCGILMKNNIDYVPPPGAQKRCSYVKELVTYIVTDDLVVKPASATSSIELLNKMEITDVRCLEEREVKIDIFQGISLLVASMSSKTVLSDIFLGKKRRVGDQVIDIV